MFDETVITDSLVCGRACGSPSTEVETEKVDNFSVRQKRKSNALQFEHKGVVNIRNKVCGDFSSAFSLYCDKKETVQ